MKQYILSLQAFNLTASATECLDSMLTESLKSRLPATSFQLFGVGQIEEDNMATCEWCFCYPVFAVFYLFEMQRFQTNHTWPNFLLLRSTEWGASHSSSLCRKVRLGEVDRRPPGVSRSPAGLQCDEQTWRLPQQAGREERLLPSQTADG